VLPSGDPNTRLIDALEVVEDYPLPPAVYPRPIPVAAAAVAADETIVVGGYRELLLWPAGQTSAPQRIQGFGDSIAAVQISSSSDWIAVAHGTPGQRGEVTLARWTDQKLEDRQIVFRSSDVPTAIAFSPATEHLAIATLAGELVVLDLPRAPTDQADGEAAQAGTDLPRRLNLTPHADAIAAVTWSADGKELLTASRDRTARVIRLQDGQSTSNFTMHERAVHGVSQIKAGTVTLDETGTLRLWSSGSRTARLERPRVSDAALGLQRYQDTVLVPSSHAVLRLIVEQVEQEDGTDENGKPKKRRVPRWKLLAPLEVGGKDPIVSLAVSPTGTVISGTQSGRIYRWDAGATADAPQPQAPLTALPQ
jgi:WD40 repeat protein